MTQIYFENIATGTKVIAGYVPTEADFETVTQEQWDDLNCDLGYATDQMGQYHNKYYDLDEGCNQTVHIYDSTAPITPGSERYTFECPCGHYVIYNYADDTFSSLPKAEFLAQYKPITI